MRPCQDLRRQDQAVSSDHRGVHIESGKGHLLPFVTKSNRGPDGDPVRCGELLNRRGLLSMTAARRPRRLCVDCDDVMLRLDQSLEDCHGKNRCAHKHEVERSLRTGDGHRSLEFSLDRVDLGRYGHPAALRLGKLAQDHPAFDHGEVIDKEDPVEVFDFVLQAGGEEP